MKPAPFAYVRPRTVEQVLTELADGEAKILAGGQSLMPVLAMRLGRPSTLVDIGSVDGLDDLVYADGAVHIGASVSQRTVEHSGQVREVPLLRLAIPFVGHRELRSRGTVCGSLAHADPAAELPAVAACLGATLEIAGPNGIRHVPADQLVTGAMTTSIRPDELLTSVSFPCSQPGDGFGFAEVARRHGDFALVGVATHVRRVDGEVVLARLTGFGVSDRPVTRDVAEHVRACRGDESHLREVTDELAHEIVDTTGDDHGSTGYRRRLLGVLAARELARAHREATG